MKKGMTFQELAKLGMEALAKQPLVTLNQARAQFLRVNISRKAANIPNDAIVQILELDCKLKTEKDSALIEQLKQDKEELFKTYPDLKEHYYGIWELWITIYNI